MPAAASTFRNIGLGTPCLVRIEEYGNASSPGHQLTQESQLIDGDTDVFGDGSVTLVSTPGHTPGSQSLLVHLKNSGVIILSGDVVHSEENFEKKESSVPQYQQGRINRVDGKN